MDRAPGERRTALQHDTLQVPLPEQIDQRRQGHAAGGIAVEHRDVGACIDPFLTLRRGRVLRRRDERRCGRIQRASIAGNATGRIDDDPDRRSRRRERGVADREPWIVGEGRARADDHGVGPRAQTLDVGARLLSRDPLGGPVASGGLAVEGRGHLEHHERPAGADVGAEGHVLSDRLRAEESLLDREARVPERAEPAAVDDGVRVARGRDDRFHAGVDQRPGARRGATVMIAGLERHEGGRAGRTVAGHAKGHRFGVLGPGTLVPPLADHPAVANQHATDQWIGRDAPPAPRRELERPPHVPLPVHAPPSFRSGTQVERRCRTARGGPRACSLPSRLSRSVPGSHRVHPHVARGGSRTVTAGGDSHPAPETGFPPV